MTCDVPILPQPPPQRPDHFWISAFSFLHQNWCYKTQVLFFAAHFTWTFLHDVCVRVLRVHGSASFCPMWAPGMCLPCSLFLPHLPQCVSSGWCYRQHRFYSLECICVSLLRHICKTPHVSSAQWLTACYSVPLAEHDVTSMPYCCRVPTLHCQTPLSWLTFV